MLKIIPLISSIESKILQDNPSRIDEEGAVQTWK